MKKYLITLSALLLFVLSYFIFDKVYSKSEEASYPAEVAEPVKMIFFGDTHFARGFEYFDFKNKKKAEEYFEFFYDDDGNKVLEDMDVVSINFESSVFSKAYACNLSGKGIILTTKLDYLKHFTEAGITHANISNNHSYDCHDSNFQYMKRVFPDIGINYYGDGRIGEENVLKQTIKGHKIAFMGFNETTFYNDWDEKGKRIKALDEEGYKVLVNIHWGEEYEPQNNDTQRKIAEKLVGYGADAIIGHHPHVVQNYEIINGVPVFYSLGNFIFDQPFEETLTGMGIYMEISDDIKFKTIYFDRSNPFYDIKKLDFGF